MQACPEIGQRTYQSMKVQQEAVQNKGGLEPDIIACSYGGLGDLVFIYKVYQIAKQSFLYPPFFYGTQEDLDKLYRLGLHVDYPIVLEQSREGVQIKDDSLRSKIAILGPSAASQYMANDVLSKFPDVQVLCFSEYDLRKIKSLPLSSRVYFFQTGLAQDASGVFADRIDSETVGLQNVWLQEHLREDKFYLCYFAKFESIIPFIKKVSLLTGKKEEKILFCFPTNKVKQDSAKFWVEWIKEEMKEVFPSVEICLLSPEFSEVAISHSNEKEPTKKITVLLSGAVPFSDMQWLRDSSAVIKGVTGDQSVMESSGIVFYECLAHKLEFYKALSQRLLDWKLKEAHKLFRFGVEFPEKGAGYFDEDLNEIDTAKLKDAPSIEELDVEKGEKEFQEFFHRIKNECSLEKALKEKIFPEIIRKALRFPYF